MNKHAQRAKRVRAKIREVSSRPRLTVTRSNKNIWAQIIDDKSGVVVASSSDKSLKAKGTKIEKAVQVGKAIAEIATKKEVKQIVFDRGSYRFHGRVKALAEAARAAGLEF